MGFDVLAEFVTSAMSPRRTFNRLLSLAFIADLRSPLSLPSSGEAGASVEDFRVAWHDGQIQLLRSARRLLNSMRVVWRDIVVVVVVVVVPS